MVSLEIFTDIILPAALWSWLSTESLKEVSTRDISLGGGGQVSQCVGLTTLFPSCADCLEIWEPQPPGTLRACPDLSWDCFTYFTDSKYITGQCHLRLVSLWCSDVFKSKSNLELQPKPSAYTITKDESLK